MSKDKNSQGIDLSNYEDSEGLSLGKLNFGLWLSKKRSQITQFFIIFLIALSAFFFFYSSYNYFIYFFNSSDNLDNGTLAGSQVVSPKNVVSDLTFSNPYVFKNGENYDFAISVKNSNDKFAAFFDYCFVISENDSRCSRAFSLPNEEKYLTILGQKSSSTSFSVSFKINNLGWQRIDAHEIPDWDNFRNSRLNLLIEGTSFKTTASVGSTTDGFSTLKFSITNKTPYSYYEMPLNVAFYRDNELIAVNSYVLNNFLAGDIKNIKLSWSGYLPGVTKTEIRPNINLLDKEIYLKYQGQK